MAANLWLAQVGVKTLYITPASPWENGTNESLASPPCGSTGRFATDRPPQQPRLPTVGPGSRCSAIAAFRFRFAPPPGGNGKGGNNALTIHTDHSVGAGHHTADHAEAVSSFLDRRPPLYKDE